MSIGVLDGEAEYLLNRVAAVRLLSNGRIVVADAGSASVRMYGPDGAIERVIGRRGQGPGEFLYLTSMWVARSDTVLVYDGRNLRVTRLSPSGEILDGTTLRTDRGLPERYLGRVSDGSHLISWLRPAGLGSEPTADSVLVGRFDGDSLTSIMSVTEGMHRIAVRGNPGYSGPVAFSPHPLNAMVGDTLFRSDGVDGLVEAVGVDGAILRSFTVPVESWSPRDAAARLEPRVDPERRERFPLLVVGRGDEEIPTLSGMLADSESLIWVKAYDPATDSHAVGRRLGGGEWWVLESDGRVITRVAMPEDFRPMAITRGRLAGLAIDDLGVERVVVYALSRN